MPTFNTRQRGWNFLQTPGPTNIPNRVLNAMNQPAVEFLGPEFIDFSRELFDDLKPLFGTTGDIIIYAANGHGSWEAALTNTLEIGEKVLIPETGRFAQLASRVPESCQASARWPSAGGKSGLCLVVAPETGELSHDRDRDIQTDPRGPL